MSSGFIPQVVEKPGPRVPLPGPVAFGAAEGQALRQLGSGLQSLSAAGAAISTALANSQDRAALADASNEMANLEQDFANDTDFETREERFGLGLQEINDRYSKRINTGVFGVGGGTAETNFKLLSDRAQVRARDRGRILAVNQTRADARQAAITFAEQGAQSLDPDDREFFRLMAKTTVDGAEAGGSFSAEEANVARRLVDTAISIGQINRLRREAPLVLVGELKDPEGPLTLGMTEAERQTQLTSAMNSYQQSLRNQLASEKLAEDQEKEANRLASLAAQTELVTLAAEQPGGVTFGDVQRLAPALSEDPEKLEKWFKLALNGGLLATESTMNRDLYVDLSDRNSRGENIAGDVADAYREGGITKSAYDALLDSDADERFGAAREFLVESLRVGSLSNNSAKRRVAAQAKFDFNEWTRDHPDASREEAIAQSQQLVAAVEKGRFDRVPAANLNPSLSVFETDGRTVNAQATAQAIQSAFDSGAIDQNEKDREIRKLLNVKSAQEARQARIEANEAAKIAREAAK